MLVYLDQNNLVLNCDENELTEIILRVADGSADDHQLVSWLFQHID